MLAIIGAMESEICGARAAMAAHPVFMCGRECWVGVLDGKEVVLTVTQEGLVAAAQTVAALVSNFDIDGVLFVGVAGAADKRLRQGDVVVGTGYVQHDMDVTALGFRKFEIPTLNVAAFEADANLVLKARASVLRYLEGSTARFFEGVIASGNQFLADAEKRAALCDKIPNLMCVDMESAAAAQVCSSNGTPFLAIRVISDNADGCAPIDFRRFVEKEASQTICSIARVMLAEEH